MGRLRKAFRVRVAAGWHGAPVWVACDPRGRRDPAAAVHQRRSGVAHLDRACDAIASVPARYLRL